MEPAIRQIACLSRQIECDWLIGTPNAHAIQFSFNWNKILKTVKAMQTDFC